MKLKTSKIAFVFSVIIVISCQQDEVRESYQSNQELFASAQNWYTNQITAEGSLADNARQSTPSKVRADWQNAKTLIVSNGKLIVVPLRHLNITNYGKNFSYSSNLVINISNKGQITRGQYLELLSRRRDVKPIESEILTDWAEGKDLHKRLITVINHDFYGSLNELKVLNGSQLTITATLKNYDSKTSTQGRVEKPSAGGEKTNSSCTTIDWYVVTTWSDGTQTEEYLYSTCEAIAEVGGDPFGGDGSNQKELPATATATRLCGYYPFKTTGDGLTGEITNLRALGLHTGTGEYVPAFFGAVCITFGSSGLVHDSIQASDAVASAWNAAMEQAEAWLNQQPTKPTERQFYDQISLYFRTNLTEYNEGYVAYANGPCTKDNIPSTSARFCF